jgi:hypothetical protein
MTLTVAGLVLLAPLGVHTSMAYIVFCLCVLGIGFGLFSSPNTNSVMASVRPRQYGLAAATLGTMRLGGQMLSMGIATLVMSVVIGRAVISEAQHDALLTVTRTAFLLFAAFCTGGIAASLARGTVTSGDAGTVMSRDS